MESGRGVSFRIMSKNPKGLAVLGSTGSVGTQTLDIVRAFPDEQEQHARARREFPFDRIGSRRLPKPWSVGDVRTGMRQSHAASLRGNP